MKNILQFLQKSGIIYIDLKILFHKFNWGNTASTVRGMNDANTVASALQKVEKAANKAMQKFIDSLELGE